jgi:Flp pilus assembly protein CpaB
VADTRVNGYEKMMRRFLVIVALVPIVGLGVFLTWSYFSQETDSTVEVIVAAHDLRVGTVLDDYDIRIIRISAADLPPGAPRRRSEVLGHTVIVPIARGTFILPTQLQR